MANPIVSFAAGIQAGPPVPGVATSVITTNTRVRSAQAKLGLATDVVTFPTATGQWFVTNQRVRVSGAKTVGSTSGGQYADTSIPSTGPMSVVQGDPRVAGL